MIGALSIATDLGTGQPLEHAMRTAVLAVRLGELAGASAEELADMHGSRARNRFALATRWARDGRVFSVPLGNRSVFPAFQFDEHGEPYPIVAQALTARPRS